MSVTTQGLTIRQKAAGVVASSGRALMMPLGCYACSRFAEIVAALPRRSDPQKGTMRLRTPIERAREVAAAERVAVQAPADAAHVILAVREVQERDFHGQ